MKQIKTNWEFFNMTNAFMEYFFGLNDLNIGSNNQTIKNALSFNSSNYSYIFTTTKKQVDLPNINYSPNFPSHVTKLFMLNKASFYPKKTFKGTPNSNGNNTIPLYANIKNYFKLNLK